MVTITLEGKTLGTDIDLAHVRVSHTPGIGRIVTMIAVTFGQICGAGLTVGHIRQIQLVMALSYKLVHILDGVVLME
tara:strand:- start:162 stop:392 length:231 start_codon:yes stop_codon:yes gene_type:complete